MNQKYYSQNLEFSNKKFNLFKLTSNERILLLIGYYLLEVGIIPKDEADEIFGIDKQDEIYRCLTKTPYDNYYIEMLNNLVPVDDYNDYKIFFNYEHLITLNIDIYSRLINYDKEYKGFVTSSILHYIII